MFLSTNTQLPEGAAKQRIFETVIPTSMKAMIAFHEREDIFKKLAMPPMVIQVNRDERTSLVDGDIYFTMWFGPFPVKWHARHAEGINPESFQDIQIDGPMQSWVHQHIFEEVEGGILLKDEITLAHKPGLQGLVTRLLFDNMPLRMLFSYRHWLTRRILTR